MIEKLRDFLNTTPGKGATIVLMLVGVALVVWQFSANLGSSEAAAMTSTRTYICTETNRTFSLDVTNQSGAPVPSPHADGRRTGLPAQVCYWTKEGTIKNSPTYLLMNENTGKSGPTFCPDCDRLVTPPTSRPDPSMTAPPLRTDYKPGAAE